MNWYAGVGVWVGVCVMWVGAGVGVAGMGCAVGGRAGVSGWVGEWACGSVGLGGVSG